MTAILDRADYSGEIKQPLKDITLYCLVHIDPATKLTKRITEPPENVIGPAKDKEREILTED